MVEISHKHAPKKMNLWFVESKERSLWRIYADKYRISSVANDGIIQTLWKKHTQTHRNILNILNMSKEYTSIFGSVFVVKKKFFCCAFIVSEWVSVIKYKSWKTCTYLWYVKNVGEINKKKLRDKKENTGDRVRRDKARVCMWVNVRERVQKGEV